MAVSGPDRNTDQQGPARPPGDVQRQRHAAAAQQPTPAAALGAVRPGLADALLGVQGPHGVVPHLGWVDGLGMVENIINQWFMK